MRTVILREIPDDPLLREQWDNLAQSVECPQVFYTYEWAISVQRAYATVARPLLLLGYEGQALIGIAALAEEREGKIVFLTGTTADYCDFLSPNNRRGEWCQAVFSELRKLKYSDMRLANLPADSVTASVLPGAAKSQGYKTFRRQAYECAQIVLSSREQRESLRCSTAGKKMLRRNVNLLNKRGKTSFSPAVNSEQVQEAVATFCTAHVSRFLRAGRLSNLIRPERRVFLHELARELSARGWLSLSRLVVGDHCVAWNYGFQFAGSWFWYQPTFDTEYEDGSPGLCLLGKIVESACKTPEIGIIDLGLGAEHYKDRFANKTRQTLNVSINSSTLAQAKTIVRYQLAQVIKTWPRAERSLRNVLDKFSRLRSHLSGHGLSGFFRWTIGRAQGSAFGQQDVHFFQWCGGDPTSPQSDSFTLQELSAEILSRAAMEYSDDQHTLTYLLRSAQRLRSGLSQGFALVSSHGVPVHFCWVNNYENFYMAELNQQLRAPSPNAVLLFDCWTPGGLRRTGHFRRAIAQTARQLSSMGRAPWIFSAASNYASVKGIAKAGFSYKFTLRRSRFLGLSRTAEQLEYAIGALSTTSVSA